MHDVGNFLLIQAITFKFYPNRCEQVFRLSIVVLQSVIEESKEYEGWTFYYTHIRRQYGETRMRDYENSLGREASSTNAFVNLLMAANADFFVGALGSTWCTVIDGLRRTGGKEMAGYLSVNKDRYW